MLEVLNFLVTMDDSKAHPLLPPSCILFYISIHYLIHLTRMVNADENETTYFRRRHFLVNEFWRNAASLVVKKCMGGIIILIMYATSFN